MTTNLYISICTNNFFFSLLLNYLQSIYFLNIFRFAECGYTWELCFTSSQILDCKIRILIWQCGGANHSGCIRTIWVSFRWKSQRNQLFRSDGGNGGERKDQMGGREFSILGQADLHCLQAVLSCLLAYSYFFLPLSHSQI